MMLLRVYFLRRCSDDPLAINFSDIAIIKFDLIVPGSQGVSRGRIKGVDVSPFCKELCFGVEYQYLVIDIKDSGIGILVFAPIFFPMELHFLVHILLLLLGESMRELR